MIFIKYLLPFVVLCIFRAFEVSACTGCIQLDEYTFDKLINKFGAVLVKFDVAFPYGDEHEVYAKIAKDAKSHDDLLIAEVGIKDYGEKDNEVLALRYNVKKDDYPVVKLFLENKKEPITLSEKPLTQDNLQKFLRANAGIHLSGPGCIPKLDSLAIKFLDTHPDKRTKLSDEANIIINGLPEKVGRLVLSTLKKMFMNPFS